MKIKYAPQYKKQDPDNGSILFNSIKLKTMEKKSLLQSSPSSTNTNSINDIQNNKLLNKDAKPFVPQIHPNLFTKSAPSQVINTNKPDNKMNINAPDFIPLSQL